MAKKARGVEEPTDKRKANWTLTFQAVKDIREVFKTDASIYKYIDTNAKTWGKVSNGDGVKKGTARDIAKEFVKFLRDFADNKIKADEGQFDSDEAADLYEGRYSDIAAEKAYEKLIRIRP